MLKDLKNLADKKKYDGVVFHRVIDGFMAQTGDVKYGNSNNKNFNLSLAGTGGSELPNLKAEFSDVAHTRGILSMQQDQQILTVRIAVFYMLCFSSAFR